MPKLNRSPAHGRARWPRLLGGLVLTATLAGAALAAAATYSGYTPGRWLDYVDLRLQGHPNVEAVAHPPLNWLRARLGEPNVAARRAESFVVPPPPPRWLEPAEPVRAAAGRVWRVGPHEDIRRIETVARMAGDGDTVEIMAGDYRGDVAIWNQRSLIIRSVGGNARLYADGRIAEGKAIWVIRNGQFDISGIDFIGARAGDHNGAGIRLENGTLTLTRCLFWGGDAGILVNGQPTAEVTIAHSEFGYIGHGDGQSHPIYVGKVGRLTAHGNYVHHANLGHLLKSRAAVNVIVNNRLSDGSDGRASYEIDLPNGGLAVVVGNIVQQSRHSENGTLVAYGAESHQHPDNRLYLAHNTLVNEHPWGGAFLRVAPGAGPVVVLNNLLVGMGRLHGGETLRADHNPRLGLSRYQAQVDSDFVWLQDPQLPDSVLPDAPSVAGVSLAPTQAYLHPRRLHALPPGPRWPGALQAVRP